MKRALLVLSTLAVLSLPHAVQAGPLRQEVTPSEALTITEALTTTEALSPTAPLMVTTDVLQAEAAPAQAVVPVAESAPLAEPIPSAPGVQFKLGQEGGRYVVYFRPTVTPETPGLLMTAQVTIRVPHGVDAERFEVADLQSGVAGANWALTSRIDAPAEAPAMDILSFEFDYESSDFAAYTWQAGQAVLAFSFANSGSYQGPVGLLENCDAFMYNTISINAGNQIAILGLNNDNAYLGAYERALDATCSANSVFLPITMRQ